MYIKCNGCNASLPIPDVVFKAGIPKIVCPECKTMFRPQLSGNEEKTMLIQPKNTVKHVLGCLTVKDENSEEQIHELKIGKQLIGRKSEKKKSDVMINTSDKTMSRNHFYIEVLTGTKNTLYALSCFSEDTPVFLNTKDSVVVKYGDIYYLQDGDIVKAGNTVLSFILKKAPKEYVSEATTIIIPKNR